MPPKQNPPADAPEQSNGTVTLSTGVVLRVHGFSRAIIWAIQSGFEVPRPPVVFIAEKGREEENPDHPAYLAAMEKYVADVGNALDEAALTLGTEVESVPENIQRPEDAGWKKKLKKHHIKIGEEPDEVYLAWLRFIAAPDAGDMPTIRKAISQHIGVADSDVQSVVRWFRREAERDAD